ncbi:hypothetical protein BT96DRAFT_1009743 [Gymnopus androsaceus JB14]|uniref:Uncharacterized protein n=1 Tax=Gymnopus androsaceus JB14 TaxID=1447944 RepID=A0A6A4GBU8_9AGAR|nr:hypothetical protein BT96DRAFT_1009743 [Gymnopus androsaceus JB14]
MSGTAVDHFIPANPAGQSSHTDTAGSESNVQISVSMRRGREEDDCGEDAMKRRAVDVPKLTSELEETRQKLNNTRQDALQLRQKLAESHISWTSKLNQHLKDMNDIHAGDMEQKNETIAELQSQVAFQDDLYHVIQDSNAKIDSLKSINEKLGKNFAILNNQVELGDKFHQSEIAGFLKRVQTAEDENSGLRLSDASSREAILALQLDLDAVRVEKEKLDHNTTELKTQISMLTEKNAHLEKQLKNAQIAIQMQANKMHKELCSSENSKVDLRHKLDEAQAKANDYQTILAQLRDAHNKKEADFQHTFNELEASKLILEVALEHSLEEVESMRSHLEASTRIERVVPHS